MSIWDDIVGTAENAWDAGTEWVEDKVIDYKINQIKKEFKQIPGDIADAFVSYDKLTPELIEQGWKIGLDNVPYNASLSGIHDPGGIYYDPDREDNLAAANAAATGGATGGNTGTTGSGSFLSQDLRQRTPSGTMYNPDISEYLNSGLFNYTGPGGVPEYTYGQGLRTGGADYGIWGTPTDVPNPYYWGQFGEGYAESTGVADGAISLPPVDLPAGVSPTNNNPNVGTNTTNINVGGGTGDKDLNYFETLAAMGIDPSDAPSTTFPGPKTIAEEEAIMNQDAVKETLPSGILDWVGGVNEAGNVSQYNPSGMDYGLLSPEVEGDSNYNWSGMEFPANETGIGSAIQGSGMGWTGGVNEAGNVSQYNPSGMEFSPDETGIFDTQQYLPSGMSFPPDESGIGDARPVIPTSPLTSIYNDNNPTWGDRGLTYDPWEAGEREAQWNYNPELAPTPSLFENDFNLGRPGDPDFIDFVPSAGVNAFEGAPLYYAWMKEDEQGNKLDHEHGQVGNVHVVAQASDGTLYDHNTESQIQMNDIASAEMGFDFNKVNSMGISSPPSVAANTVTSKPFVNYGPPNMRR